MRVQLTTPVFTSGTALKGSIVHFHDARRGFTVNSLLYNLNEDAVEDTSFSPCGQLIMPHESFTATTVLVTDLAIFTMRTGTSL
jgi:hypothetical protein